MATGSVMTWENMRTGSPRPDGAPSCTQICLDLSGVPLCGLGSPAVGDTPPAVVDAPLLPPTAANASPAVLCCACLGKRHHWFSDGKVRSVVQGGEYKNQLKKTSKRDTQEPDTK